MGELIRVDFRRQPLVETMPLPLWWWLTMASCAAAVFLLAMEKSR